jgi:hypothetical protein
MDFWSARPIRDRHDRYVRRARLRVSAGAPRHRLAFAMEEALRLLSLPGEDQGRTYYFRYVRIAGLPPGGDRGGWLKKFQEALEQQARQAVYAAAPWASQAEVVFFHSEQEALEILLHRMLTQETAQEWFWPMVAGKCGDGEREQPSVLDVVERLRAQPASWAAVARALFARPRFDTIRLLRAIPAAAMQAWIEEMEAGPDLRQASLAAYLAAESPWPQQPAVRSALQVFGAANPGVLWLSALADLLDSPSDLAAGVAVRRARIRLQRLALAPGNYAVQEIHNDERATATRLTVVAQESAQGVRDDGIDLSAGSAITGKRSEPIPAEADPKPAGAAEGAVLPEFHANAQLATAEAVSAAAPAISQRSLQPPELEETAASLPWLLSGAPTRAAGLFFLLNAMGRIGMAEALSVRLAVPQFVPRLLLRLGQQSGAAEDDPILAWLQTLVADSPAGDLPLPLDASFWPGNLSPSPHVVTAEDLVRLWSVAVRRWCWRLARVNTNEIVRRDGVFFVNRTDLDVSLPIEATDVRIRKAGLDLDPGWLPWFGHVVRFQYLFRGELYG